MRSTFSGLDIARRALQTNQQAIDVVNHNIANANTPGYSRQIAYLTATPPYSAPAFMMTKLAGQMGTGVMVADVRRSRYAFIDYQLRGEAQSLGRWEKTRDALRQLELVFNEPSDSGINSMLTKFWQAWHDLTNAPQDAGARRALVEQADSLAVAFNRKYSQMISIQKDLDQQLRTGADTINQLAQRLTSLNVQIAQVELSGQRANDLRDQRDIILDELSNLTRISYYENPGGAINVFIGGRSLVSGSVAEKVAVTTGSAGFSTIVWDSDLAAISLTDGQLYGLQQARDVDLPRFIGDIQALAQQFMSSVNSVHRTGYGLDDSTGLDFFTGSDAGDMAINSALRTNPAGIATAGASGSPGDNSVALAIVALQSALTMNGGTTDFGRFLSSTVSRLGVDLQGAEMMAENQQVMVDHIRRQKDASSGVSLDEETTRLIEYQRAYEAAARVVNVVDEMLELLINGTGLVGR